MYKCCSISFFLANISFFFIFLMVGGGFLLFNSSFAVVSNYFIFDNISFYLILLIILLGVCSGLSFFPYLTLSTQGILLLSLIFSSLCFLVNHCVLFWCFYELSMLPLLYLIFKESPYSERFSAGWYFTCYLLITSLPLIVVLLYLTAENNSFFFNNWCAGSANFWVFIILSFIFFTKIPLVPFHTWLPIVHAEATSIVSIFLSGYIMKLGLLGVYRCSYFMFSLDLVVYLSFCFVGAIFFFIISSGELDGKRWLAFLSLAHIVIPFFSFFISDSSSINYSFFYCLGHGLSAGIVFGLLWYFYDSSNSRNWLLLKSAISFKSVMLLCIASLLSLCSFPPSIQFFCEIGLIKVSAGCWLNLIFWCVYLFLGGLVPVILCGHLLIRSEWIGSYSCSSFNYFNFIFILCFWCYMGALIF